MWGSKLKRNHSLCWTSSYDQKVNLSNKTFTFMGTAGTCFAGTIAAGAAETNGPHRSAGSSAHLSPLRLISYISLFIRLGLVTLVQML